MPGDGGIYQGYWSTNNKQNHQGWYKGDASSYFFHFLNKVYTKAEEKQEKNAIFNNFYYFIK